MKKNTNKRQDIILTLLEKGAFSISRISQELQKSFGKISKVTVNRDLTGLIHLGLVEKEGRARATFYKVSKHYNLIREIDVDEYFAVEADKRESLRLFNFEIFKFLKDIFLEREIKHLEDLNKKYQENIKTLSDTIKARELQRLIIEFSWKSSRIEGNTYSLLETENLLLNQKEAAGHQKEEAIMILNHKKALDFILKNPRIFRSISIDKIEHLHSIIIKDLNIPKNLRKFPVGITGTSYKPLDNEWQIKEALEKTCKLANKEKNPFAKSIILSVMIAYIQPFVDGNKRTARILGNAMLLAASACPLSYRSASEGEYKKAVILFYEQNNISYYKKLFIDQFEFAVLNYFRA